MTTPLFNALRQVDILLHIHVLNCNLPNITLHSKALTLYFNAITLRSYLDESIAEKNLLRLSFVEESLLWAWLHLSRKITLALQSFRGL